MALEDMRSGSRLPCRMVTSALVKTTEPAGQRALFYFSNRCASLENISRHPHPALHQNARAAAHDGLGDRPATVHLLGFRANAQRTGGMAEAHCLPVTTASGQVDQRTRHCR